jgi:type VI secretion system protein ImpF
MADLTLKDRLQPSLLDRLIDEERAIVLVRIETALARLEELRLPVQGLIDVLVTHGLVLRSEPQRGDTIVLEFSAPRVHAGPAQLRAIVIKPPGAPLGIPLHDFATVESQVIINSELEAPERRMMSMRKLREVVHRDLASLLNSINLDSTQDLAAYPQVARSVLNYGMPSFAGIIADAVDPNVAAQRLKRTIEVFEPRLSAVRVTPQRRTEGGEQGTLTFTIEALLWGQPAAQHLELRTTIDMLTGDVSLSDSGAR